MDFNDFFWFSFDENDSWFSRRKSGKLLEKMHSQINHHTKCSHASNQLGSSALNTYISKGP